MKPYAIVFALLCTAPAAAQTFDVASIKPNTSGDGSSRSSFTPGGGYLGTNVTLQRLILDAYGVQVNQIVDGPAWLNSGRFDVDARAAAGSSDDSPARLRALLAERFHLATHMEQRPRPVYALKRARAGGTFGPGLKPSTTDCQFTTADGQRKSSGCGVKGSRGNWGGTLSGTGQTLAAIAAAIGDHGADRPVVDRTGVEGRYDFSLEWRNDPKPGTDDVALPTAVREQLGLTLATDTVPVDVLVIDGAELPTEN